MKQNKGLFSQDYWMPIFGVSSAFFFILAIYFGYLIWFNNNQDFETIQRIDKLQALSTNVEFLSQNIVTGDADAVNVLNPTIDSMDRSIDVLLDMDDFTIEQLGEEYKNTENLWSSIQSNAVLLSKVDLSISRINAATYQLGVAAVEAQKTTVGIVKKIALKGARSQQVALLNEQVGLIQKMSTNMNSFSSEAEFSKKFHALFVVSSSNFEENYKKLLAGNFSREIKAEITKVYQLLDGVRGTNASLSDAVKIMLEARDAKINLLSSLDALSLTFDELERRIQEIGNIRFPQIFHVWWMLAVMALCLMGFFYAQKQSAQQVIEKEQSDSEGVQAAILRLLDELADLADGDLTVTTTVSEDFTGAIADSVNFTIDQLRQLVSRINSTAVQVSAAAQESQQTALHLAEASDHQAQEIAGASAAINEMAVTIDQVSANAAESALVASKSVSIANNGAKLVQNTIHGMDTIREQIQDTSKRIKRLGESSQEIGDIVSLINDIADQTNILALNAAIQASMAGDAGRGFAVVADEVQRLAERSAAATKQIETLVKTIQSDTNEAVTSMEQTTTEVVGGARLAQDAGVALEEIEGVSANIAELIQNISNAARQQASSAGHISSTMNVIQEITSQTSAGTGATAQAIGDLADMALELRESVAGFTLPESELAVEAGEEAEVATEDWMSIDDLENVQEGIAQEEQVPEAPEEVVELDQIDVAATDNAMDHFDIEEPSVEVDADLQAGNDLEFSEEMPSLGDDLELLEADFDLSDFEFTDEEEAEKAR